MFFRALLGLLMFTFAASASADPRQELHVAFAQQVQLKAFKATMVELASGKTVSTAEFQAPDRFRISTGGMPPSVVVGGVMYLQINGQTMKVPFPAERVAQYRNPGALADLEKNLTVESLGPGMVGEEPARKYRFNSTGKHPSVVTAWVGVREGWILQMETSGKAAGRDYSMRILYSDFNSPAIKINTPN